MKLRVRPIEMNVSAFWVDVREAAQGGPLDAPFHSSFPCAAGRVKAHIDWTSRPKTWHLGRGPWGSSAARHTFPKNSCSRSFFGQRRGAGKIAKGLSKSLSSGEK